MSNYNNIATNARKKVLELIFNAQTSHIGSNFSCIDILSVLFDKIDLDKDKFVLSKGWASASLYYFLWLKERIEEWELDSFCGMNSKFIGLTEPIHPDIPVAGGSMGFGLPMAIGLALAKRFDKESGKVYVLMSDGELDCGTTWESMAIIEKLRLNNIKIIVDCNGLQGMGKTKDVLDTSFIKQKFEEIDGHDFKQIERAVESDARFILANTIKGKGVSFMENENIWHYKAPNEEEYDLALKELCQK